MLIDTSTIQDTEKALTDKGIKPEDFQDLLALLEKRQQALTNLGLERQNQFYGDAFNLMSQIQKKAQPDNVVAAAMYLRTFAEHVTKYTLLLQDPQKTAKDIVDAIPQLGEVHP